MKSLPNIEKSGFHRGQYVGYGDGKVWRIVRWHKGDKLWRAAARKRGSPDWDGSPFVYAATLVEMSSKLESIKV